jgi:hypothetical protein
MMDQPAPPEQPEITLEPADNGWVVRHHQRSTKKDEPGRTIRRVASTDDEALEHARTAMGGGKSSKKKSTKRDGQTGAMSDAEGESGSSSSPAAHSMRRTSRSPSRRRHPRIGGRR